MDFGLSETQELIRSTSADWLSERASPDFVRAMAEDERGYTDDYWRELAELGWLGLLVPEQYGGSGMEFSDMAVLLQEWGAALAPGPLVESSVVSAYIAEASGSDAFRGNMLQRIAAGDAVVVPAIATDTSGDAGVSAHKTSDGWVLEGTLPFVPYANSADVILLPASTEDGIAIFALDAEPISGTVSKSQVKMASGVPTFNLELNEVVSPEAAQIIEPQDADTVLERAKMLGATAWAIQMVGAGKSVADRTLEYVKERRQFGRPIGAFQAIQHYMADMAIKVKSAQHLANRAAWSLDNVDDPTEVARAVSQAKWAANTLMPEVCWTAHQSHGAIGFTWEHDLHLYTRRVLSWRAEYGDVAETRAQMARHIT